APRTSGTIALGEAGDPGARVSRLTRRTARTARVGVLGVPVGWGCGILALVCLCALPRAAAAQDTYLLVITGVEGDAEHGAQFHKWASALIDAAQKKGGLADATVTYLADKVERDPARIRGRSTSESVRKAFADLAGRVR